MQQTLSILSLKFVPKGPFKNIPALVQIIPDSKVHRANMGPTWVLSAPRGPHVGPMDLAIWDGLAPGRRQATIWTIGGEITDAYMRHPESVR